MHDLVSNKTKTPPHVVFVVDTYSFKLIKLAHMLDYYVSLYGWTGERTDRWDEPEGSINFWGWEVASLNFYVFF